jgi:ribosome biogenesis protein UTP30
LDIPQVAKVIGFDKLKRKFKLFKDKRMLLKQYDGFLADIRIYKMLPECLGKEFYDKKRFPCPVKLHGLEGSKQLQEKLNAATQATYFTLGNGPNYSVRVGRTN